MATRTLGTNATTTLTAVQWSQDPASMAQADLATVQQLILDMAGAEIGQTGQLIASVTKATMPIAPGAFTRDGMLFVPNRGFLRLHPGDFVGVDATGWPILVANTAIAGLSGTASSWTHT